MLSKMNWYIFNELIDYVFYFVQHWSSCVGWLSNVVASVPMVFVPLAVFMSRPPNTSLAKSRCFPSWDGNESNHHHQEKCSQLACPSVEPSQEDKNSTKQFTSTNETVSHSNTNKTASHTNTNEIAKLHTTNTKNETSVQPLSDRLGADNNSDSVLAKPSSAPATPEAVVVKASAGDKRRARENLKFYLGTDILVSHAKKSSSLAPSEHDDTCIILDNEWPNPDTGDDDDDDDNNIGESKA